MNLMVITVGQLHRCAVTCWKYQCIYSLIQSNTNGSRKSDDPRTNETITVVCFVYSKAGQGPIQYLKVLYNIILTELELLY